MKLILKLVITITHIFASLCFRETLFFKILIDLPIVQIFEPFKFNISGFFRDIHGYKILELLRKYSFQQKVCNFLIRFNLISYVISFNSMSLRHWKQRYKFFKSKKRRWNIFKSMNNAYSNIQQRSRDILHRSFESIIPSMVGFQLFLEQKSRARNGWL